MWFSRFLEWQDDGDLPNLERLQGGEAEVENVQQLLSRSWPFGAFGAHLEDDLIEFLLSQDSLAAISCSQ